MGNCIQEFEQKAKEILDRGIYDYIAGAAGDESGLTRNGSELQSIQLLSRALRGIIKSDVTLDVPLLGKRYASPFLIAPMGYQSMVHPEGEIEMARAAESSESVFVVPTLATQDIEMIFPSKNGQSVKRLFSLPLVQSQQEIYNSKWNGF